MVVETAKTFGIANGKCGQLNFNLMPISALPGHDGKDHRYRDDGKIQCNSGEDYQQILFDRETVAKTTDNLERTTKHVYDQENNHEQACHRYWENLKRIIRVLAKLDPCGNLVCAPKACEITRAPQHKEPPRLGQKTSQTKNTFAFEVGICLVNANFVDELIVGS